MDIVLQIVCIALDLYFLVLIARILVSWVSRPPEPLIPVIRVIHALTDPILEPLRRAVPALRTGSIGIDFSPFILFLGINLLQGVLCRTTGGLF